MFLNNSNSQCFFYWEIGFPVFSSIIALFTSWKLLELLYIGPEHKLSRTVSSISVQDLNRAAIAIFSTQIQQIRTHFEQPQSRFITKWKIWTLFEHQLKKFQCLLKIKERFQKFKYQASHVLTKTFKSKPQNFNCIPFKILPRQESYLQFHFRAYELHVIFMPREKFVSPSYVYSVSRK